MFAVWLLEGKLGWPGKGCLVGDRRLLVVLFKGLAMCLERSLVKMTDIS